MNANRAVEWGNSLAGYLIAQKEDNPFLLAAKFGWQVVIENEDDASVFMPTRLAEWDGRRRLIRLFVASLRRHLGNSVNVLSRACAHELFHGLVAAQYRVLSLPEMSIPSLNYREEEIAAQAFSAALLNS
jgi:hypothetical protein